MFVPLFANAVPVVKTLKSTEIELIIFDSDGTLVDSELLAAEAMVDHAGDFGVQLTTLDRKSVV